MNCTEKWGKKYTNRGLLWHAYGTFRTIIIHIKKKGFRNLQEKLEKSGFTYFGNCGTSFCISRN